MCVDTERVNAGRLSDQDVAQCRSQKKPFYKRTQFFDKYADYVKKHRLTIVVKGHALIQERRIGDDEVREYEVSGDRIQTVMMLPGYTHNIINLSDSEELITLMWANECFDPDHPDTFFKLVK